MKPFASSWEVRFFQSSGQRFWLMAGLILAAAAILRLAAFLSLRSTIYFDYLLYDERFYHDWAVKIADGTWHSTSIYEFAPLYAYVMAGIYKLFSPDLLYIRCLNLISGILTCLFIGLVGREIGGRRLGLGAMLLAAFYKPLIFYSLVPLKTALSVLLFSLFMWFFLSGLNNSARLRAWFMCGLAAGLMINIRPNYLAVLPVVIVFILTAAYRESLPPKRWFFQVALLLTGFGIAVSPFVLRNYRVAGKLALSASQAGFNFYVGNNPANPLPYYRPVPFASSSPFYQGTQFNIEAGRQVGHRLSPREASAYWIKATLQQARNAPRVFAGKIGLKTLAFFNRFEAGDHYHIGFIGQFAPFFRLSLLNFEIILALAMAGLAAGAAVNRKVLAAGLVFIVYGLTLIAFFCNTRYRLPMVVILIPLAVYGIRNFIQSIQTRKFKKAAGLLTVALVTLLVSRLPVTGTDDMSGYYSTHALILSRQGRGEEALRYWQIASDMKQSYSAAADLALAGVYLRGGHREKARAYLARIPSRSFAAAGKYELLGDMAVQDGDYVTALDYYRTSIRTNSGRPDVRRKLIRILETIDPGAANREKTACLDTLTYYQ